MWAAGSGMTSLASGCASEACGGWPAGTDCIVSQDIVQGVETVERTIEWLQSNEVQAVFDGA